MVLAGLAAIAAAAAAIGMLTGAFQVKLGQDMVGSAAGAFLGTAGIAVAFVVVVLALAIVLALVYGLGFVLVGVALLVAAAVAIGLFPVLAPFILVILGVVWLVRRSQRRSATLESADAHRNPG
jgi:hypothetical protein